MKQNKRELVDITAHLKKSSEPCAIDCKASFRFAPKGSIEIMPGCEEHIENIVKSLAGKPMDFVVREQDKS